MTEETNKNATELSGIFSVVIPIVNIITVYLCQLFSGNDSYINLISSVVYIVCFDFILFYFIKKSKTAELSIRKYIFLTLSTSVIFSVVYVNNEILTSVLILLAVIVALLSVNSTTGLLELTGLVCYYALFAPQSSCIKPVSFLFALSAVIVVEFLINISSLIQSVICLLSFYLIIGIITGGFSLEAILSFENLIICMFYVAIIAGAYLVKSKNMAWSDEDCEKSADISDVNKEVKIVKEEYCDDTPEPEKIIEIKEVIRTEEKIVYKTPDLSSDDFPYIIKIKKDSPKLYKHCKQIAALSSDAASLIGADTELAYILGMYHEASRLLGDEFEKILKEKYGLPGYLTRLINLIKQKDSTNPINREAGIIILSEDIIGTINYLVSKNETVSMDRVVTNAIKVRKEKGVLRQAGFSNEEIQLLKLFYVDAGGNYDTSN